MKSEILTTAASTLWESITSAGAALLFPLAVVVFVMCLAPLFSLAKQLNRRG